jgi:glycosyltransferase involved in cell wall biosynthesis
MSPPLVSVVIPAHNAQRFLGRTLESVASQTHRELEVIVVDDGSTDRTAEIVRDRALADPRFRLVQQPNAGVTRARNRGIAEAGADLVAFLDSDDLWHPRKIERQLRRLEQKPEAGLVWCWSIGIDENDAIMPQRVSPASFEGDVFAAMLFQNFIGNASAPLVRRECLDAVGGFDEALWDAGAVRAEDRKFFLDVAERYDYALVPEFLVGYRQLAGSASWDYERVLLSLRMIMDDVRKRRPELPNRLFRWSTARVEFYLGLRAASLGNFRRALSLCAAGLWHDPSLILSHWFRYSLGRAFRKTAAAEPTSRIPFAEAPVNLPTVPAGWVVQRQRDYAASVRIERRHASRPHRVSEPVASAGSIPSHG